MQATVKLLAMLPMLPVCAYAAVQNVVVQGTSPTQAVIAFTVPNPNDCLVQVSTDPAFGSLVDDTNDTLFPGAQKCNRAGSSINGNDVVFVAGLRTSQKASDGRFHSRALRCNTIHYYRIVSEFQPDPASPRSFQTTNPPLGATFPEPPPFDPTLTAFGNYAWPEIDWSDPAKAVIDPLTGIAVRPFTRPGIRSNLERNLQWSTPYDAHGTWTDPRNAATNGTSFATGSGGPADYLFLPLPWFHSPTGANIAGWNALWGFDDILVRPYGSAAVTDGTHNVVSVCLSIDSGQTCASSSFNITLTGSSAGGSLIPASVPKPLFANWALAASQGQKAPVQGSATVSGSTVTQQGGGGGQYFDVSMAPGSKIFITGSSLMAPKPCPNDMCTVASVQSATQITIVESCQASGCPVNQPFTAAAFGLRVAKTVSTGSVSVSFGYDRATSEMVDAGVNGAAEYCNDHPVTVSTDRTGKPLSHSIPGYLCTSGGSDLLLLLPSNADGTPRSEVRLLSSLESSGFTSNHLSVGQSAFYITPGGFDPADPAAFYTTTQSGGKTYIFKGTYDTSATDGDGRACDYREWPQGGPATLYANTFFPDCIRYTNMTDATASPPMDLGAQVVRGYQTGLNSQGQPVTKTPHPGFDLSFMHDSPYNYMGAGLVSYGLSAGNNGTSGGLTVIGTFDLATGLLKQVVDTWSQLPARYGSCHGCFSDVLGPWRVGGMNNIQDIGGPLNGTWQANVTQVNRAGAGATPAWDTNTALTYNEGYNCPPLSQDWIDMGGSGPYCVQVKISSEACSHKADNTFVFANGKTELQNFPCTTNVAGNPTVPSTAGADTWSKLQDIIVGDWLQDLRFTYYGGTEKFVVASKKINAANDIDLWLIRAVGCRGAKFPSGLMFGGSGASCDYGSANNPSVSTHLNGWSFAMAPPFSNGTDSGAASMVLNPLSLTTPWVADNFLKASAHGAAGASPTDGNYTSFTPSGSNYSNAAYSVLFDKPFLDLVYVPFPVPSVTQYPSFAGKSGGPPLQNYGSLLQFTAPPKERVWGLDYRHINPTFGGGAESANSGVGNGQVKYALTAVAGTTQTYQLATNANGQDSLSQNTSPDIKRLPLVGVAGRYLLKDYSGPATGNVFGDRQSYGFCYSYKAEECRMGSTAGQLFVSVPAATVSDGCHSDQYGQNIPCVFSNAPPTAQIMQFDLSVKDLTGSHQRRLGYGLAGPLRQYQFNNARATPDGRNMVFPGNWVDGQRRELMIADLPPWPRAESQYDRTTFVPVRVPVNGDPNAPNARVRFGYAENGPPDSLFCTGRQESCSTDIPAQAPTDPYSFVSETPKPQSCSNSCTINIPAISERVVYYIIDWLSQAGSVVRSSPLQAQMVAGTVPGGRR